VICVRDGKEVVAKKITRDNLVRPAFHYDRDTEPTSIAEARAKATGTYGPMQLYQGDDKAPAYLPRRGQEFDNDKIKLAGPPSAPLPERPAPVENREVKYWLTRIKAIEALVDMGVFDDGRRSEEDLGFVDLLMNGRDRIEYDEIVEAAKKALVSKRL